MDDNKEVLESLNNISYNLEILNTTLADVLEELNTNISAIYELLCLTRDSILDDPINN